MNAFAPSSVAQDDVLVERRGCAGFLILNRPKALNALTLAMVRMIAQGLDDFEREPSVGRVVIMSSGGRAFCAGGDIRRLYQQGLAGDHASQLAMWREEYQLNRRIKRYAKPIVALIDGIVMGGGMGLSLHGSHCVASERTLFAMPEVSIGFFPDVGATWLLPRLPHRIGVYLAVTGARIGAGDICALGLARSYAASIDFPSIAAALESSGDIDAILRLFAQTPPEPSLEEAKTLEFAFALGERADILAALSKTDSLFASQAAKAMMTTSPTSQAIALRQMQIGGALSFEEALKVEFRIVSRIARGRDFYEGVRALIIDKNSRPAWSPLPDGASARLAIDAYFTPLGEGELSFPERKP